MLEVEKLCPNVTLPTKATKHSACLDVAFHYPESSRHVTIYDNNNYMHIIGSLENKELVIPPGYRVMVPTALKFIIPRNHHIKVYSRSSMALKRGLIMVNSVGIIDEDFDFELKVLLMNISDTTVTLVEGERIAQIELCQNQSLPILWDIGGNAERTGGYGSSGK